MNASFGLVLGAIVYVIIAVGYYFDGRPGMVLAFAGYLIGNLGLLWDALSSK